MYRFGQFALDSRKRTLSRADSPISLTPKAFDVLLFLVQNPNRLVTKEELLQAVWGDTFVEEGNLTQYISHIRKALGDNSEDTRLIVTIARKGYQFTVGVTVGEAADTTKQAAVQVPTAEGSQADTQPVLGSPAVEAVPKAPKYWRNTAVMGASAVLLVVRAIALKPGDPDIVRSAAYSAAMLGRFEEALLLARQAIALDPLNADSWECLGETEFFMGQLDKAAADGERGLELSPDAWPGPILLSQIYVRQGRPQAALPEIELIRSGPWRTFLYPMAYYALGRKKESDTALNELIAQYHEGGAYQIAQVYAFRNQFDEAFEWLDRAYAQRDSGLVGTNVDPLLKSLHSDPRYAALLKKLKLPI